MDQELQSLRERVARAAAESCESAGELRATAARVSSSAPPPRDSGEPFALPLALALPVG
jgi:hypothetical protein